jgi:hypothetical protein
MTDSTPLTVSTGNSFSYGKTTSSPSHSTAHALDGSRAAAYTDFGAVHPSRRVTGTSGDPSKFSMTVTHRGVTMTASVEKQSLDCVINVTTTSSKNARACVDNSLVIVDIGLWGSKAYAQSRRLIKYTGTPDLTDEMMLVEVLDDVLEAFLAMK